jgi:AraC-like DNA-binding protein
MDAFSEILSGVKLRGAVFFSAEFSSPWGVHSPPSSELTPALSPGAQHLVIYHFVVEGSMRATLADGTATVLEPGDIVVFPHGDAHRLSHGSAAVEINRDAVLEKVMARDLTPMCAGGGGPSTKLVCGFMACDPFLCKPILEGLPPLMKVNIRTDRSGQWLENSILHLVQETASGFAGSDAMLAKLSEALFVDLLRRYVASLSEGETGWLAGARDAVVGRSLAILHSRVAHPWTIAELAAEVGVSRTSLVERFSRYLDEAPMAYLTRWRLRLAARALTSSSKGVGEVAADVGYESEAAFNRAFKREFGVPPARYRRDQRAAAAAQAVSA